MGRPPGRRNKEYEAKREGLARAVVPLVLSPAGRSASLNDLAEVAGASVPTLRHYFTDRPGVVAAALESLAGEAHFRTRALATPSSPDLTRSLADAADSIVRAWQLFGVDRVLAGGLVAAAFEPQAGPAYVNSVLEPLVQATEERLKSHAEEGALGVSPTEGDTLRLAALQFVSPLLVALLHQHTLFGATCRPLDLPSFVEAHVARFARAWAPPPPSPPDRAV